MKIYKPEQGVIARITAASLLMGLTLMGVWEFWIRYQIDRQGSWIGSASQYVYPLIVLLGGMALVYYLTNSPKMAEHLIEAEIELKKVVWPKQSEIVRATLIVLVTVVVMALMLFLMDMVYIRAVSWAYSVTAPQ